MRQKVFLYAVDNTIQLLLQILFGEALHLIVILRTFEINTNLWFQNRLVRTKIQSCSLYFKKQI